MESYRRPVDEEAKILKDSCLLSEKFNALYGKFDKKKRSAQHVGRSRSDAG